jgi:hypothetical protein
MNVRSRRNEPSSAASMRLNVAASCPTASVRPFSEIRLLRSALRAIASASWPICVILSRSCNVWIHSRWAR